MPQALGGIAVAIKGAVGGALGAVGVSATTAYGIGSAVGAFATSGAFLMSVGASVLSAVLAPQVDIGGAPDEWQSDLDAPIPFVIGRNGSGGYRVHRDSWGADNRYRSIVTVYSGAGPIQGIEGWSADGEALTLGANGVVMAPAQYANKMWIQSTLGDQPQAAALTQTGLDAASPAIEGWGTSSRISGKAHSFATFYQDSKFKSYPAGVPELIPTLLGIKCYDPRLDSTYPGGLGPCRADDRSTWLYTVNPYLHAIHWILGYYENGKAVGGIDADASDVDLPAFVAGANVADANGWEVSGRPTTKDDKHEALNAMLQAGGGRYIDLGGRYSCIVNAPGLTVATVTADDTAGEFVLSSNTSFENRLNTLTPRCPMESHRWKRVDQDPVTNPAWVTEDRGQETDARTDYPYVAVRADGSNANQPAELAAYDILNTRESLRGMVPLKAYMRRIRPGDIFTIDDPRFLLSSVEVKCLRSEFDVATGVVNVVFQSETAGKHDFALGRTNTPPSPPSLTAPDYYNVAAPAGAAFSATAATGNQPAIVVAADADNDSATAFILEYRVQGASTWVEYGQFDIATTDVVMAALEPNTTYEVTARYVSQFGIRGARLDPPLVVTTGSMVADDATGPSQDIADFLAGFDPAAADLGELADNLRVRLNALLVDSQGGTDTDASSAIESALGRLNDLTEAVAEARRAGDAAVKARLTRTDAPGGNLDPDPTLALGFPSNIAPAAGTEGVGGTLDQPAATAVWRWSDIPAAATDAIVLNDIDPVEVRPGQQIELTAAMETLGVCQNPRLRLVWLDANGAQVNTPAEVALAGGYIRGGSYQITVPAGAAKMQRQFIAGSSGAGVGYLLWRDPVWRFANEGQAALTSPSDGESNYVSTVRQLHSATRNLSVLQNSVFVEIDRVRASVEQIISAEAGEAFALASDLTEVRTLVGALQGQLVTLQEAFNAGTFAELEDLRALQVAVGDINAIEDYTLVQGVAKTLRSLGGTLGDDDTSDPRAARVQTTASASGVDIGMAIAEPFTVVEGGRLGWACDVEAFGPLGPVRLGIYFLGSDGSLVGDLEAASVTGSGWIGRDVANGIVTVPANAKFAAPYVLATSSGSGAIGLRIRRLGAGAMGEDETGAFPWSDRPRQRVLEAFAQQRLTQSLAQQVDSLRIADGEASIRILEANELRASGDALAAERAAAIEGQIGTPTGGTLFGRIGQIDQLVIDLSNNKLEASTFQTFETSYNQFQSSYSAFVVSTTDALDGKASTVSVQQAQATADQADGRATQALGAITENESAAVFFRVLLEASGGDPAIIEALAGKNGSGIGLAATAVWLANLVDDGQGGLNPAKVIEVSNQIATVLTRLRLGPNAVFDTADGRMEIGALSYGSGAFGMHFKNAAGDTVLLLDVVNQVFDISPAAAAAGFLGSRQPEVWGQHYLVPVGNYPNGPAAQAAFSTFTRQTPWAAQDPSNVVELDGNIRMVASAGLFEHFYYTVRITRSFQDFDLWEFNTDVLVEPDGVSQAGVSANAKGVGDPTPKLHPITEKDVIPAGVPAGSLVRYILSVEPRNIGGPSTAFENWADAGGTKTLEVARASLFVRTFRQNLFN